MSDLTCILTYNVIGILRSRSQIQPTEMYEFFTTVEHYDLFCSPQYVALLSVILVNKQLFISIIRHYV